MRHDEINEFERLLADDGEPIVKVLRHISPIGQLTRFEDRSKRWKLTYEDFRTRDKELAEWMLWQAVSRSLRRRLRQI